MNIISVANFDMPDIIEAIIIIISIIIINIIYMFIHLDNLLFINKKYIYSLYLDYLKSLKLEQLFLLFYRTNCISILNFIYICIFINIYIYIYIFYI